MRSLLSSGALVVLLTLSGCGQLGGDEGTTSFPSPPAGSRWVGSGQVVVAAPDWWTTGETQCYAPVEDTVYFDSGALGDCPESPTPAEIREVSALAVLDASSGYGEKEVRGMRPVAEVDGHQVLERAGCEEWFEGVCRRLFAVPSAGVVFAVTIAEEGDGSYEEIRDSVRILPDDLTTVPLATTDGWTPTWGAEPSAAEALVTALEDAGLRVEIVTEELPEEGNPAASYASLPEGSLLDVRPQLGSVVDVGGTVTVTVAGSSFDPRR